MSFMVLSCYKNLMRIYMYILIYAYYINIYRYRYQKINGGQQMLTETKELKRSIR